MSEIVRMKIMIVNTLYSPYKIGGAEVSVQLLAEELVMMGNEVRVICMHQEENRKEAIINGVKVVYLPLKNIYWPYGSNQNQNKVRKLIWHLIDNYNIAMAKLFRNELIDFSPEVVHTNNLSGFSVSIWNEIKKRKIKLVHTARDYYLFHPGSTLYVKESNIKASSMNVKAWSFLKRLQSKKIDSFVGISDYIRDFHSQNAFFKNAIKETIYNSVEVDLYYRSQAEKHVVVGFIGRLTEDKGFNKFCDIAEEFSGKDEVKFIAAGRFNSDNSGRKLDGRAKRANINVLGFVPVTTFLEQVDFVVLPIKWQEPFGRAVVECAMSGKIVLTNLVGGVSELERMLPNIYDLDKININNIFCLKPKEFSESEKFIFNKRRIAQAYFNIYQK
ncbi:MULTISPECIES: glycosyltransferase family 4 protein [Serratia]|uniref:glycosyltransferase family 4 protein n=1 Tax=Serratia TaxID=613 RepID=UPI001D0293E6|nr:MULTISPECIES: glycosyltransferase family 4 protein [Serratia]MDB6448283.1 glycosyltransferase family 4 protein [Serratia sp. 21NM0010]